MGEREADRIGLEFVELAHLTVLRQEAQHIRVADFDAHDLAFAMRVGGKGGRGRHANVEALDMRGDLRKLRDRQFVAVCENHRAKHSVFQLAHVAGPVVACKQRQRLRRDSADIAACLGGETRRESAREIGDVLAPRAQGRNADRKDVEPIEQVLAELSAFHEFDQILVRRRDQSDVNADGTLGANGIDLAFLQRAQQLDLNVERKFADLVEKQRSAIGFEKLARVFICRAGEGAFLVAKEYRLDEIGRQRAAIDRDEGFSLAVGAALDRARDKLLADAGFSLDQNRDGGVRGALPEPDHARHMLAARDKILEGERPLRAAADAADFARERIGGERVLDRNLQTLGAHGFDDEVMRAGAHRRNHRLDRAMRGLHDDGRRDLLVAHARQHAHAVEIGHHEIENEKRDRGLVRLRQPRERLLSSLDCFRLIAESPHHGFEQAALNRIVVGDEYRGGHQFPCCPRACGGESGPPGTHALGDFRSWSAHRCETG